MTCFSLSFGLSLFSGYEKEIDFLFSFVLTTLTALKSHSLYDHLLLPLILSHHLFLLAHPLLDRCAERDLQARQVGDGSPPPSGT